MRLLVVVVRKNGRWGATDEVQFIRRFHRPQVTGRGPEVGCAV